MKIETTVNMHKQTLERIEQASIILNKSQMYIIRLLMGKLLEDERKFSRAWTRIKYQKRDLPENWTTYHVILREDEYEYSQDLRKVYKMTFSYLIAYAVDKFLDIILKKFTSKKYSDNTDNYLYKNYSISYAMIEGVHCWKYCWGYTPRVYTRLE